MEEIFGLSFLVDDEEALPEDYEECGDCGFDHAYEWAEALKEHTLLGRAESEDE